MSARKTKKTMEENVGTAVEKPLAVIPVGATVPMVPPNPSDWIRMAIEKNVDVGVVERLTAIYFEFQAQQASQKFHAALSQFQSECPVIEKGKEVVMNGQVRYKYAPLDAIVAQVRGLLNKLGFSYTLDTAVENEWVTVVCKVNNAGHTEESRFKVPIDRAARMNDSQKVASALTYAKRYAFCNAFGILTGDEDDDAQGVGTTSAPSTKTTATSEAPVSPPAGNLVEAKLVALMPKDEAVHKGNYTLDTNKDAEPGKKARQITLREFPGIRFFTRHKLTDISSGTRIYCTLKRQDWQDKPFYWLQEWDRPQEDPNA